VGVNFAAVRFSAIIPLFNRPDEIRELLESLTLQTYTDFEVLIVEDGSTVDAREIVEGFADRLDIHYFFKTNSRQGFARNYGFERARGEWFVVFDSDCIIPAAYFEVVSNFLEVHATDRGGTVDVYGGPDAAHPDFTDVQKAISYSMTSYFTTGGIRGREKQLETYNPRSFNMGISRRVWEATGGYRITVKGEDIEFSVRTLKLGFRSVLIPAAHVFHKRRTSFSQFYTQLRFFGTARINVASFYPEQLRPVHVFPTIFWLYVMSVPVVWALDFSCDLASGRRIAMLWSAPIALFTAAIFIDAWRKTGSARIAVLSVRAAFTQLIAYGRGLWSEFFIVRVFKRRDSRMGEVRELKP
tara:strand:- start:712 stop:1779 length:1068 start_codon:yes stop_codon:yes gene_type:complete